jgi:hypothetical protein
MLRDDVRFDQLPGPSATFPPGHSDIAAPLQEGEMSRELAQEASLKSDGEQSSRGGINWRRRADNRLDTEVCLS